MEQCKKTEQESLYDDASRVVPQALHSQTVCAKPTADEESTLLRPRTSGDPAGCPRPRNDMQF